MRRWVCVLAVVWGLLGACSNESSHTKIMVVVWSNLEVPTEIDSIHVDVSPSSSSPSFAFPLTTGSESGKTKLPAVLELVSPDNKGVGFDVVASGYQGRDLVVAQAAHLSFDPDRSRVLTLFLDRMCRGVACAGDSSNPSDIDVTTLPEYDPRTPFLAPDGSAGMGQEADQPLGDAAADLPVATPEAGTETSTDNPMGPLGLDTSSDTPFDPIAHDDIGRDLKVPDTTVECLSSTTGCTPSVDGGVDSTGALLDVGMEAQRDAGMDTPPDAPNGPEVSPDTAPDLPAPAEAGQDLAAPDGLAACVLPMTTCAGACVNPQTSSSNCGACGQACSTQNGTPTCTTGACSMSACSPGFLDCSVDENTSRDGCETNGNSDSANCRHCGNVCSSRVCRNQTCLATARYGDTGPGVSLSSFQGDYLAGIQVYIPSDSVVTGFGAVLYAGTMSCNMYLGLYKDMAGKPGDLVATVPTPTPVAPGGKEWNVDPPIGVTAGTYWLLGVWDVLASFASNSATTVNWLYTSYRYSPIAPLPSTAPTSMSPASLPPPNLYVIVAQ